MRPKLIWYVPRASTATGNGWDSYFAPLIGGSMGQVETVQMNIDKVRDLAIQVAREQQVPDADAESARGAIRSICREASMHGLTTAEVVRAIFRPVLEARSRGCYCPTCIARRERQIREEILETADVGYQPPSSVAW